MNRMAVALRAVLVLILTVAAKVSATRPETVLANVFTRPFVPRANASPECIRDSEIYLRALADYAPWALQMYDSSVKIPSGLITGNHRALGNWDECLRVKNNEHGFIGQACNVAVQFNVSPKNDTMAVHELDLADLFRNVALASGATNWTSGLTVVYEWIWCVPSSCNYSEIQRATETVLEPLIIPERVNLTVNVYEKSCQTWYTDRGHWDAIDCCYLCVLVLFALIIVISTGYEIALKFWYKQPQKSHGMVKGWKVALMSFSMYKNGKELLGANRPQNYLRFLDGLRFLSICWIIFGHSYYMQAISVKLNLADIPWLHHDWTNMLTLNANIATDTFFLLSGTVLAYSELSKKERNFNWSFSIKNLWIRRYLRLTPPYVMMIGFYATLFYKFGSGPHWDLLVGTNRDYCRESWWLNLIYLNNYFNLEKMCMSQTWYLSVDMQLVWFSPLILYPMLKMKKSYFLIILNFFLVLSFIVPFTITYIYGLPGTMLYYKNQMDLANVYVQIYSRVYCRFGTYFIGIGLGYILQKTQKADIKLRLRTVICGWIFAIVIGLAALLGLRGFYFDDRIDVIEASFYAGLHRQIFALSIAWIIFCCMHGYAGPVNSFLSWSGWTSLSSLTYCAYLSHYVFLISDSGTVRAAERLTRWNVLRSFLANLVLTLMLSMLWYLCFEVPFLTLEKFIFDRKQVSDTRTHETVMAEPAEPFKKNETAAVLNERKTLNEFTETGKDKPPAQITSGKLDELSSRVYVIKTPAKNDDAPANSDGGYVNINFYRSFDENESNEITLRSTNVEITFSGQNRSSV